MITTPVFYFFFKFSFILSCNMMIFERRMNIKESPRCFFNLLLYCRNDAWNATLLTFYFIFTVQCRKFGKHVIRGFVKGEENIVLWFLRWFTRRLWDRLCSNASRRGSERCFISTNLIPVNPYSSPLHLPILFPNTPPFHSPFPPTTFVPPSKGGGSPTSLSTCLFNIVWS